jgi:hypothetical protein
VTKQAEDEIARNRRETRKLTTYFEEPIPQGTVSLAFSSIAVETVVAIDVESRDVNETLISGHPDASQGSGRGESGDNRGSWSTDGSESGTVTSEGREVHAEALAVGDVTVDESQLGTGAGSEAVYTSALDDETGTAYAWYDVGASDASSLISIFTTDGVPLSLTEFGLFDDEGRLVSVANAESAITLDSTTEVRLTTTLSYSGDDAAEDTAVTAVDEISEVIVRPEFATVIDSIEIGSDDTAPAATDSGALTPLLEKRATRELNADTVTAFMVVFESEPSSQPVDVTEMALISADDVALTRRVFESEEKDEIIRLRVREQIRFE